MKIRPDILLSALLLGTAALGPGPVHAQLPVSADLVADAIETPAGPQFSIVFSDAGTGATDYLLERTPEVGAGAIWTVDSSAVITSLGGGSFRATTQRPLTFGAYRLVAYNAAGQLAAQFASPTVELEEGESGYNVYVLFSRPFTGTLNYVINDTSGGQVGPFSGSIAVSNATSARIPVNVADNSSIGELKFLSLTILAGGGVAIGGSGQTVITIRDNDALWDGAFVGDGLEFSFKYRLTRNAGISQAVVTSDGSGILPAGEYPVTFGTPGQLFPANVNGINLAAGASLLNLPAAVAFTMAVQNGVGEDIITDTEMQGSATVAISHAGKPHLSSTRTGRFILLRPPPAPPMAEVQLVNNP